MESQQLVSPSWQCSSTPVGFGQELLSKEHATTLEHPSYSPNPAAADFYLFPRLKSTLKDGAFVMLLTSLRMGRKSWKGFHKMSSRNVSNTFTVLAEVYSCTGGLFERKYSLNCCTLSYFFRNTVIQGTLWSYHLLMLRNTTYCHKVKPI